MYDLAIASRRILTPHGIRPGILLINGRRIAKLTHLGDRFDSRQTENVGSALLLPGVIDAHVHVNEPGRTEWEGFETASLAAATGGVTTFIDMPLNSIPVTTTGEALRIKQEAARPQLWVNVGFYGGVVPGNVNELPKLAEAGAFGCKTFLCDSGIDEFPRCTEEDLRNSMPVLAQHGIPLLVHAELCSTAQSPQSDPRRYESYLQSRPGAWEVDAIQLVIRLSKEFNCPVHIVHLSCADALEMIGQAKNEGVRITAETCPHYLTLSAEEVADGHTEFKCAPPIRNRENRDRLWQGLDNGTIDFVASDHSPCTPELKRLTEGNFQQAWGGIASLQFALPAVWTEAKARGIPIERVIGWFTQSPAAFLGLSKQKGKLSEGADADIIVFHPEKSFKVEKAIIRHRHKVTPYLGKTFNGVVERTFVGGHKVFDRRSFENTPAGEIVCRPQRN
jgi:allantoinase